MNQRRFASRALETEGSRWFRLSTTGLGSTLTNRNAFSRFSSGSTAATNMLALESVSRSVNASSGVTAGRSGLTPNPRGGDVLVYAPRCSEAQSVNRLYKVTRPVSISNLPHPIHYLYLVLIRRCYSYLIKH